MRLIRTINLEKKAKKAYFLKCQRDGTTDLLDDDILYSGGREELQEKNQDICSRLFNLNSGQKELNADPDEHWDRMTKLEKEERVEQLWRQARKYNNQLRFKARLAKMSEKNMH